jgi:hypothetical protein
VVMKSSVFWDITPCSRLKVNRRFGETCRLHIQSRRISQEGDQRDWFLDWLILRSWIWRRHVPPKRRLTFNGLHGDISQKITLEKYMYCTIIYLSTFVKFSSHTAGSNLTLQDQYYSV